MLKLIEVLATSAACGVILGFVYLGVFRLCVPFLDGVRKTLRPRPLFRRIEQAPSAIKMSAGPAIQDLFNAPKFRQLKPDYALITNLALDASLSGERPHLLDVKQFSPHAPVSAFVTSIVLSKPNLVSPSKAAALAFDKAQRVPSVRPSLVTDHSQLSPACLTTR